MLIFLRIAFVLSMLLSCVGCESGGRKTCPSNVLSVRPFAGPPVTRTSIECSDGRQSTLCTLPLSIGTGAGCNATTVTIWPRDTELGALVLYLSKNEDTAFAWIRGGCDDEPCDSGADEALDGWIEVEQWDGEALKGSFNLTFGNGGLLGTFDSSVESVDAGL